MRTAALLLVAACSTTPTRSATGELGAWQAGPALPTPRANHCSAAIDNWVLVIGGNYQSNGTFVKTDEIHAAPLAADGRRLYVIDGLYDTDTDSRKVYTADLDAHGMLSPLASMTDLPTIAISSEATVHGRDLVVMHSSLDTDATGELSTPVTAPTWTTTDLGITFRAQPQYAFTATHAYTLGGYHDTSAVLADAFVAPLAGGPAVPTTPLPTPTGFGEAVAVDDYVFLVGGRTQVFGGSGTTATYAAHIEAGGALEAWQPATALPMGRTNHDLVRVGDFLVLTGGATSGGGDATVLVSQVRY